MEKEKFLLVSQHPVTTEYGQNRKHMRETLMALNELRMPTIMFWPNADAGSDEVSKEIRTFRERYKPDDWLHLFINLPFEAHIELMDMCACMVGNSSNPIREGAIIGTPTVNIGTRQMGRLKGDNVIDVPYDRGEISGAVKQQASKDKYKPDNIYGDGKAGKRIAKLLKEVDLKKISIQKKILI